ncbi:hypothetical protein CANARDRAFT_30040 [[Candida] arabinofermentans NRRL YB-2248]|uniref:BRCT domain-containing protein n=1 Tax=[Candida] arabinofermentans NRRL YB-2248 TaxID=983967 RepID=A0A1E4SV90_9ASCO|nr:hypothetical protein CANARDRAFT_30040 [[Candida] arabinofermentans NRRL YB-2248]
MVSGNIVKLTSTGLSSSERSTLVKLLAKLYPNAVYSSDLTSDVSCLVLNTAKGDWINSNKYQYVVENRPDIVLIEFETLLDTFEKWLKAEEASKDIFELKTMRAFENMNISLSRLPKKQLDQITRLVSKKGGNVSESMTNLTSVLITTSNEGKRYEKAIEWGIPVVTPDWCFDSSERGAALNTKYYILSRQNDKGRRQDACNWERLEEWKAEQEKKQALIHAQSLVEKKRKIDQVNGVSETSKNGSEEKDMKVTKVDKGSLWDSIMGDIKISNLSQMNDDANWESNQDEALEDPDEIANKEWTMGKNVGTDKKAKRSLFEGLIFKLQGFDYIESRILKRVVSDYSGEVTTDDLDSDNTNHYLLVSSKLNEVEASGRVITELAIERCLFLNKLVFDDYWSKPFIIPSTLTSSNMYAKLDICEAEESSKHKKVQVCITGFMGIELTHLERLLKSKLTEVVQLNELFNKSCELLIFNDSLAKSRLTENEKLKLGARWGIKCLGVSKLWKILSTEV